MDKRAQLFHRGLPKAMPIALDPMLLKAIGAVIQTHRITFPAANGSAAEANQ